MISYNPVDNVYMFYLKGALYFTSLSLTKNTLNCNLSYKAVCQVKFKLCRQLKPMFSCNIYFTGLLLHPGEQFNKDIWS